MTAPTWKVLPVLGDVHSGCLCCPPKPGVACMSWDPHPGFGLCELTRNGETHTDYRITIFSTEGDVMLMQDFEDIAAADPDNDWRVRSEGPLGGVVYQRQGDAEWVAVESLEGFA